MHARKQLHRVLQGLLVRPILHNSDRASCAAKNVEEAASGVQDGLGIAECMRAHAAKLPEQEEASQVTSYSPVL